MQDKNVSLNEKNDKRLFFSGVAVLTVASLLVKFIGVFYKVPLNHLLGSEGMAAFNAAYSIYTWLYTISTAGLPVAVSILISESRARNDKKRVQRIFRVTTVAFLLIGVLGTLLMALLARPISLYSSGGAAFYPMLAIAPALFFICISSAFRGYFQGFQEMLPTAISQVIEALCKVVIGVVLAYYALKQGYSVAVAAAFSILGVTLGIALGMVFLIFEQQLYLRRGRLRVDGTGEAETGEKGGRLLRRLLVIALPITVSASILSLTNVIDTIIMADRLNAIGYEQSVANGLYGDYSTGAVTLFNLPTVLIYPISYSIVPVISAAIAAGRSIHRIVESAMRVAAIIGLPCSLGLSVFAKPIIYLVFRDSEMARNAGPLLSILSLSIFFVGLLTVSNSILQSCGSAHLPIYSMCLGGGVKLLASYVLIGIPEIGIAGTPIGTLLCYFSAVILDLIFVMRRVKVTPQFSRAFLRPALCALFSVTLAAAFYMVATSLTPGLGDLFVLLAIALCAAVYLFTLFFFRAVTSDDVRMLPKGERILRILLRFRLLST